MDTMLDRTGTANLDPEKIDLKEIDAIVETLFRTNNQPTPPQRLVLQTFLDHTNSGIQSLKHEIERLRLQINAALSVVRLLPSDVLIRIFEYVDKNHVHCPTSILRLSHVCAAWRNAALTGRSLWNTLFVSPGGSPTFFRKDVSSLMRLWFDKAGPSQALSIHVLLVPYTGFYANAVAHGLVAFAPRLRSINLELEHGQSHEFMTGQFRDLLTLPGGQFSSLETLRFVDHSGSYESELPPITAFDNSPLLHTVTIKMTRPTDLVLPWHQLAHLEIGGKWKMRLSELAPALFRCYNLRTAILHLVPIDNSFGEITPTTFPHLQVLKLRNYLTNHLANFLSLIRLPNLHTLELSTLDSVMTPCQPMPFVKMFPSPQDNGSYLSLRRLSFIRTGPNMEQLLELLDRCSRLEELVLYLPLPPAYVLECLTPSDSRSPPSLAYLKSFAFGSKNYGFDPLSIMNLFGNLVCSWIMDPRRVNALSTVEFIGSDDGQLYGPVVELCEEVKGKIQKCCADHGSSSSPITVLTHRIRDLSRLFWVWGIRDPTVQDWSIPS